MKIVLVIFFSWSLTENKISNSIETTRHEMSTEVSSTTNSQMATMSSIGTTSKYENYSLPSSTLAMTTAEEALVPKIIMRSIQIMIF